MFTLNFIDSRKELNTRQNNLTATRQKSKLYSLPIEQVRTGCNCLMSDKSATDEKRVRFQVWILF